MRWVDNLSKPFFRLAVVEAEGVHKVRSKHPIFVDFLGDGRDPVQEVNALGQKGFRVLLGAGIGSFVANFLLIAYLTKTEA